MKLTEKEKSIFSSNEIVALERMSTFMKRNGDINASRHWELKSSLECSFRTMAAKIEDFGYLSVSNMLSHFKGNATYENMINNYFVAMLGRSQNNSFDKKIEKAFNDETYQNDNNVTPDVKGVLKYYILDKFVSYIEQEKSIKSQAYEAALVKFEKSRAKDPEPVNKDLYAIQGVSSSTFKLYCKIFKNEFISALDDKKVLKDVLGSKAGFKTDLYENRDLFEGNLAQVLLFSNFLQKSFCVNRTFDGSSQIIDEITNRCSIKSLVNKKIMFCLATLHEPFTSIALLEPSYIKEAHKKEPSYYRKLYDFTTILEVMSNLAVSKNGVSKIIDSGNNYNDEFDLRSTNVFHFSNALDYLIEKTNSNQIREYTNFYKYRIMFDEEYKEQVFHPSSGLPLKNVPRIQGNLLVDINNTTTEIEQVERYQKMIAMDCALQKIVKESFYDEENDAAIATARSKFIKDIFDAKMEKFQESEAFPESVKAKKLYNSMENVKQQSEPEDFVSGFKL